jgi:hypothetical protein
LEAGAGQPQAAGYTIYPASTTRELWELYKQAESRLEILNNGRISKNTELGGYLISGEPVNTIYDGAQVRRAMDDIQSKIPEQFLKNYRIFLAPFTLSGVSGQGGVGFGIIYALPESFKATEDDLRVTLYHELGHHIHLSYMPAQTTRGKNLWEEYFNFRGGSWHGDGKVNTTDWSKSSEETFAEDFRMIFGNDQPYFGDMALGDPRVRPGTVKTFQKFVKGLALKPTSGTYRSPWIPEGRWFWMNQEWFIGVLWLTLLLFGSAGRFHLRLRTPVIKSSPFV